MKCDHYDYVEIACLFKYPLILELISGEKIAGIALDTQLNGQRQECIKLKQTASDTLIILDDIVNLEVSIKNPHFDKVNFI